MLSTTDLLTIQSKPEIRDLTLQTIQNFYDEHLCRRLFTYTVDHPDYPVIQVRFEEDNLCHLLGIHYILKSTKGGKKYTAKSGYDLIRDGTVTFEFMEHTNKKGFKGQRNRMLYFPFVYQILQNPTAILFSTNDPNIKLDVDIIFYNHIDNTYLHLGLGQQTGTSYYYPKSFFDRKKDDRIQGQTKLNVLSREIIMDS